jgi:histone acetyltransferase (RNA polymerase elongator complex component)
LSVEAKRFIIPIFVSHLGCPQRCIYCDQGLIAHAAVSRPPATEEIATEIERYLRLGRLKNRANRQVQVAFYGGTFTALPPKTQEGLLRAVGPFFKEGVVHSLRVSTRPDALSAQCLEVLAASHVATIELGVQSMTDEVLRCSRRGYNSEQVREAVREVLHQGFEAGVQLMVGLPGESSETFAEMVEEVIRLQPHFVRLYPTIVIRGTRLEQWFRAGDYQPLTLEEAVAISKEALKRFRAAGIPVIRIGLQPTPTLPASIVAGPYHPAFRQLVEGALLYEQAVALLAAHKGPQGLGGIPTTFIVAPQDISTFYGERRANITRLCEAFDLREIRVQPDPLQERGTLALSGDEMVMAR